MKLPLFVAILSLFLQGADPLVLFLSRREVPIQSYRGSRRMDGWWGKDRGWLEVAVEFNTGKFSYTITEKGGSGQVIEHALEPSLKQEKESSPEASAFSTQNYAFSVEKEDNGLTPLRILPKRKEGGLIDGFLFVRPENGELVKVQGKPAKDPSRFFSKNELFTRYYENRHGFHLPVLTVATAKVLFKDSLVVIHYQYQEINGRAVSPTSP